MSKEQVKVNWKPQKLIKSDNIYLKNRERFAKEFDTPKLFEIVDHFGLYVGMGSLSQKLFCYEIFKKSLNIPGHIIEFGVWKGSTLIYLAKLLQIFQPYSHKLVIGFDNFSGLPAPSEKDSSYAEEAVGEYCGDLSTLLKIIELYNLDDMVHLVVGDAKETIPVFAQEAPEVLVSLALLDFDLYEPTKSALDFLAKRLSIGGIIVFDEGISNEWHGETTAMLEFLNSEGGRYKMEANPYSRQPSMYIIKES